MGPGALESRGSSHSAINKSQQNLFGQFEDLKNNFTGLEEDSTAYILQLPNWGVPGSENMGIVDGQITITAADLKVMFQDSVTGILNLIQEQLTLADAQGCRVRSVVGSGGFFNSLFLQRSVDVVLRRWRIDFVCGEFR